MMLYYFIFRMSPFSPKSLDLFQRDPFRFRNIEISRNNRQNSNTRIEQERSRRIPLAFAIDR